MHKLLEIGKTVLDLLFPREACEVLSDSLPISKLEQCTRDNEDIVPIACIAPLSYKHELVQQVIYAMKYYNHTRAPELLATAVAPYVIEALSERQMFGAFHNPLLVAIPLHTTRQAERGYNQSERIATALAKVLPEIEVTCAFNTLQRKKNTSSQVSNPSRQTRIENMHGAFIVQKSESIQNRDIILVDDVVTTGATLSEAKNTLLEAGASAVLCVAVAH